MLLHKGIKLLLGHLQRRTVIGRRAALLEAAETRENSASKVLAAVRQKIESAPLARIDYTEIIGSEWRSPISKSLGSWAGVILTAPEPKALST